MLEPVRYTPLGRWLIKSALALADFRSYRDQATRDYLSTVGIPAANDAVYPDLAFSLAGGAKPRNEVAAHQRPIVGLGVMLDAGPYGPAGSDNTTYRRSLDIFAMLGEWLLAREYNIRLLIGGVCDRPVRQELKCLLEKNLPMHDGDRIIEAPDVSVDEFLSELAETEFVVATRFHNVLLALLCNKPVIAISFHPKCTSLMSAMGLSEYCLDINHLDANELIEKVQALERNAGELKYLIRARVGQFREALEEQYELMFNRL